MLWGNFKIITARAIAAGLSFHILPEVSGYNVGSASFSLTFCSEQEVVGSKPETSKLHPKICSNINFRIIPSFAIFLGPQLVFLILTIPTVI